MRGNARTDKAELLATAKEIASIMKARREGTNLRIRMPRSVSTTATDGWNVIIGDLGKGKPRLEIWYDRFAHYSYRKYWACFSSDSKREPILQITGRVSKKLWPVRTLTMKDVYEDEYFLLWLIA